MQIGPSLGQSKEDQLKKSMPHLKSLLGKKQKLLGGFVGKGELDLTGCVIL